MVEWFLKPCNSYLSKFSCYSAFSHMSALAAFCHLSILAFVSCNTLLSAFSINSALSVLSINSFASVASVNCAFCMGCIQTSFKVCPESFHDGFVAIYVVTGVSFVVLLGVLWYHATGISRALISPKPLPMPETNSKV
ncbi:hypothetical protein BASA81_010738 [Batrachochytrium salamandrivorans]|nr:hypothetical protein BASA81_010738 [Batrachochytrium salamandrivorans]